ncbi:Sensor histidine kinase [Enhygromyxa salina]|uniref:histidine kinase n=1 Tax=Enhygromyxa salina TaxID=215803 RepID=A0A0C2CRQ6_9BACT|nr:ATP-binding protein [Enhygromyxa salina]KIG12315.1 Sensor histidine kinase [Enhygromyxa salina]
MVATRDPQPADTPTTTRGTSLFVRIYATFVVSVLGFAVLVGLLVFIATSSWNEQRVLELVERAQPAGQPLARALLGHDDARLRATVEDLEQQLDAHVAVLPRHKGRRLGEALGGTPGAGPQLRVSDHPLSKAEHHHLRQGLPLIRRRGLAPPSIGLALFEHGFDLGDSSEDGARDEDQPLTQRQLNRERGRLIAVVTIDPKHSPLRELIAVGGLLLLVLAGGAWPLARSLTSRLAKLERSTRALAQGELSHRAEIASERHDEVDRLAVAFNEMADRLETSMTGQRTLLANVSHELRTPIARTKVLVEILAERIEQIRANEQQGQALAPEHLARLERGFAEMQEDIDEVEALIRDLLTSGRLELGRDGTFAGALAREDVELAELCAAAASRFGAEVECEPGITLEADRILLQRLLENLLTNARRACPEGSLVIRGERGKANSVVIEVEDDGPGIPADQRTNIFEPFARLDAARARDQGGVGLGLYLCRQIAAAHGGSIRAEARRDGHSGARFVIQLRARHDAGG